jgi:hypothetical protein
VVAAVDRRHRTPESGHLSTLSQLRTIYFRPVGRMVNSMRISLTEEEQELLIVALALMQFRLNSDNKNEPEPNAGHGHFFAARFTRGRISKLKMRLETLT